MNERVLAAIIFIAAAAPASAQPFRFAGTPCEKPPVMHCPDANCPGDVVTSGGSVVESKTGRTYFLDYPCDLKQGEKVTFILSLHGGGSYGNWQRHYFPLVDYKDRYRLVIATPFSPRRVWAAEDDEYLQNIVSSVVDQIDAKNIKAFWLVGHSQGGITSNRIVRTDFFKTKVDGWLSLSGGRLGGNPGRGDFSNLFRGGTAAASTGAAPTGRAGTPGGGRGGLPAAPTALPDDDFSFIYEAGQLEADEKGIPDTSQWAMKLGCGARKRIAEIEDTKPGYVYDRTRQDPPTPAWGLLPRPGKAVVFEYPKCKGGRVVADVVRLDKGHTEGLEPAVTEALVKMMLSARGGKIQTGR
jgi:hypothetical protein